MRTSPAHSIPARHSRRAVVALATFAVCFVIGAASPSASVARPRHALAAVGTSTRTAAGALAADSLGVNAVTYQGWKMFEVYCTRCHGEDAVGSSFAPALKHSVGPDGTIDHKAFWLTVTYGRPAKGMPTWGNLLTPEQKESIWNYLRARAVGHLPPGRPHIAAGAKKDSTAFTAAQGNDSTFVPPFVTAAAAKT